MSVIHHTGSLIYTRANGDPERIAYGRVSCCAGEREAAILASGLHTSEREQVTCRACLRLIEKARRS